MNFQSLINRGNSGTADTSSGFIPQPIPKTKWIWTRKSTLPTANPTIPILIGCRGSAAHIEMTTRLMAEVIAKCVGVHDWPLEQLHRRPGERHRGSDKQPAAALLHKSCPHHIYPLIQHTCFETLHNYKKITQRSHLFQFCVQLLVLPLTEAGVVRSIHALLSIR